MTVTADTRERDLIKCDGCGMLSHRWHRVCLSSDGAVMFDVQVCRACESDGVAALKLTWQGFAVKR